MVKLVRLKPFVLDHRSHYSLWVDARTVDPRCMSVTRTLLKPTCTSLPWVVQVTLTSFNEQDREIVIQIRQSSSNHATENGQFTATRQRLTGQHIPTRTSTTHDDIDFLGNGHCDLKLSWSRFATMCNLRARLKPSQSPNERDSMPINAILPEL